MKKKLQVLKQLRRFRNYNKDTFKGELTNKLYIAFFIKCIILSKTTFTITFKNKVCKPSYKQWISYIKESFYRIYLLLFKRNKIIPNSYDSYLITYGADKPMSFTFSNTPDEFFLDFLCNMVGLKVLHEEINLELVSYKICLI